MSYRRFSSILLLVLLNFAFAVSVLDQFANAAGPIPELGSAVLDGDINEWNIADPLLHPENSNPFGILYVNGDDDYITLGHFWLRCDPSTETMYMLVIAYGRNVDTTSAEEQYVGLGGVVGSATEGTTVPFIDLWWVSLGAGLIGYEAAFKLEGPLPISTTINVHLKTHSYSGILPGTNVPLEIPTSFYLPETPIAPTLMAILAPLAAVATVSVFKKKRNKP